MNRPDNISNSITDKQLITLDKILEEFWHRKLTEFKVEYNNCTIDIVLDSGKQTSLTTCRFRIFWHDASIGFLKAGAPYFDGYEVYARWIRNVDAKDVYELYMQDIKDITNYYNK